MLLWRGVGRLKCTRFALVTDKPKRYCANGSMGDKHRMNLGFGAQSAEAGSKPRLYSPSIAMTAVFSVVWICSMPIRFLGER